jgi:oligopeptide transport system substrate-binding protein
MGFLISILTAAVFSFSVEANTLHVRIAASPVTLDWTGQVTVADAPLVVNVCEGLFGFEYPAEKLIPAIAGSLKKSKDLTEYTFQIRESAKWSDGRPIYAKDFVDGWQRLLSPQSTSIYSYYLFDIVNAREFNSKKITSFEEVGIRATSDRTLVIKFKYPQKNWEVTTSFWPLFPVRKDLIEKFGNNWWRAGTLVSSGPFIFSSFEPGKKATLKRNPYYRKTVSNIKEVEVDFLLDQDEAIKKYNNKYYPFITGIRAEKYLKNKNFHPIPLLRHYVIAMNAERFPFNNKYFRLAILSSIDREKMMPQEYTQFKKAKELIPTVLFNNNEDLTVPYNPKLAKEYLSKSGVILSKGFKISFLTGLSEPFYEVSKKIASQIETNLGIPVDTLAFKNQEFETFSNLGEYNMLMLSWTAKVRTAQDFLFPYSVGYSAHNRTHYSNADYDQAIETGEFKRAQLIIAKENAVIHPLFFEKTGFLAHSNIKNIYFDHRGLPLLKDAIQK